MKFSVIVPVFNAAATLPALIASLDALKCKDFEVLFVDDGSTDASADLIAGTGRRLISMADNRGPARCRNAGAAQAVGEILVFTDADCRVHPLWLDAFDQALADGNADAVMGRLVLMPSTPLGDAISALGFPAGGSVGFDKIWPVDADGFTESLSTCNCAVRREVFCTLGGFAEDFPFAGGEDSFLAYSLRRKGYRIRYWPEAIAWHPARARLDDFIAWQFKRGFSSYLFARRVEGKRGFVGMRGRSSINVLQKSREDGRAARVATLLAASMIFQGVGFLWGAIRRKG